MDLREKIDEVHQVHRDVAESSTSELERWSHEDNLPEWVWGIVVDEIHARRAARRAAR